MNIKSDYKILHRKQETKSIGAKKPLNRRSSQLPFDSVHFGRQGKSMLNKSKAMFLSLMTLFPTIAKADDTVLLKIDEGTSTIGNSIKQGVFEKFPDMETKLVVSDKTLDISDIKIYKESEVSSMLKELSNDFPSGVSAKKSYYYEDKMSNAEIIAKKLKDYTILVDNIPQSVLKSGTDAVNLYKSSVISILKTCGEYGAMYIKNIPDVENMLQHAQGINRLAIASEKVQGCKFQNVALFNGFSADELMKKVVIPNEKIANGELVGQNQNTLIMITHEFGSDPNQAYAEDFSNKTFLTKHVQISDKNYDFEDSFLGHYDNILVIQPNGKNADDVLNKAFPDIEKGLYKGAKTDIIYIAQEVKGYDGAMLSNRYPTAQKDDGIYMFDTGDFKPIGKGGKPFSVSIEAIFKNAIDKGYSPNFIGDGCYSEFLENCVSESNRANVNVYGTPYKINGACYLGFADNKLELIAAVSKFFDNNGLLIRLMKADAKGEPNEFKTNSFLLNKELQDKIIYDYKSNIKNGVLVKSMNGMIMEYRIQPYLP